jgi:putative ABC transport system permease protein
LRLRAERSRKAKKLVMLKNYLIIAVRHLARHKLFSTINILCLAIGITFSMLIAVYVINEENVNSSIKNIGNQYVIKSKWKVENMGLDITTVAPLAKSLKENYPTLVANYYRFNPVTNVVSAGDKHFKENISIGDTNFVSMYGFKILYGNEKQAFKNNSSAVITETMAVKLFGNKNAVNKTITITNTTGSTQDYSVSAVLKTMSHNSVNNYLGRDGYHVFVPFEGNQFFQNTNYAETWDNAYIIGMIELQRGLAPKDIAKPIAQTLSLHAPDNIKNNLQVEITPLKTYYLQDNNSAVQKMITTLSFVAAFILLLAIINFVNINIGTSSYRLKEIGLRKVFGSGKAQLMIQHLAESFVLTLTATCISLIFYELLQPAFNQLLNTRLEHVWVFNFSKILFLVLLVFAVGFVAGICPAFVLSSSKIISSAKGKIDSAKGGLILRKTLLLVQFTLAIVVFISALNVSKQVSYLFNRDLGYNKDQLLVITAFPKQWDSAGVLKMEAIRNQLMQLPEVRSASLSFEVPDRTPPNGFRLIPEGSTNHQAVIIPTTTADENYAATFGLKMKEGTFFSNKKEGYIPNQIVLNEAGVKALGWKSALNKKLRMENRQTVFTVAGVVKDYNYSSMQMAIGPLAFTHVKDNTGYRFLTVKLSTLNTTKAIDDVRKKWKEISPTAPFDYFFMDDKFQSLYESELQLKKAANIATILNLIIVLLGVFGVVAFTLTRRTKEIAVRKVLGASVATILSLFMKEFLWVIIIAGLIACPIAWFIMHGWLSDYAYRISLTATPFIISIAGLGLITALLITIQTIKAGTDNPVKSLRTE